MKNGPNTWVLSGLSGYTGATSIQAGRLSINTIRNVGAGSSSVGNPSNPILAQINIGFNTTGATLRYTGSGGLTGTTDRVINLAGSTGGATIEASGTGPLVFTSNFTASSTGSKTLTLRGSNTGANTIGGSIPKGTGNASVISVVKVDAGSWVLSAPNEYLGPTTVSGGLLQVGVNGTGNTGNGEKPTTVAAGASLAGSGTISGAITGATITNHVINGSLLPGDLLGTALGNLTFKGNLILAGGSQVFLQFTNPSSNDPGILAALASNTYNTDGGYRINAIEHDTWEITDHTTLNDPLNPRHDSINVPNGTVTFGSAAGPTTVTIVDKGYISHAQAGDVFDFGDWLNGFDGEGTSANRFKAGDNRNGGSGGGNLILPTLLNPQLLYDVDNFVSKGIITIITNPAAIPVLMTSFSAVKNNVFTGETGAM